MPLARLNAFGINQAGRVVGVSVDLTGIHGFLYRSGDFSSIDVPGNSGGTEAFGINEREEIVGLYFTDSGRTAHGFIKRGGNFTTIDFPSAALTQLNGINGSGQIVGLYLETDQSLPHGFLYDDAVFQQWRIWCKQSWRNRRRLFRCSRYPRVPGHSRNFSDDRCPRLRGANLHTRDRSEGRHRRVHPRGGHGAFSRLSADVTHNTPPALAAKQATSVRRSSCYDAAPMPPIWLKADAQRAQTRPCPVRGAAVRFRSGGTGIRLYAKSAGRSSAWPATLNGADTGKS